MCKNRVVDSGKGCEHVDGKAVLAGKSCRRFDGHARAQLVARSQGDVSGTEKARMHDECGLAGQSKVGDSKESLGKLVTRKLNRPIAEAQVRKPPNLGSRR